MRKRGRSVGIARRDGGESGVTTACQQPQDARRAPGHQAPRAESQSGRKVGQVCAQDIMHSWPLLGQPPRTAS